MLAELKEECGLDLQLGKCKLYIKGTSLAEARALVRSIINAEPRLSSIPDMLQGHEDQFKKCHPGGQHHVRWRAYWLARLRHGFCQDQNNSHGRRC